jgi:uncharacterized protein (DUF1778 family)
MQAGDHRKNERMDLRLTLEQKNILKEAADLLGESLANFVISTALRDALELIREHQRITLSERDWTKLEAAMLDEGKPNEALRTAARRYRNQVIRSEGL